MTNFSRDIWPGCLTGHLGHLKSFILKEGHLSHLKVIYFQSWSFHGHLKNEKSANLSILYALLREFK